MTMLIEQKISPEEKTLRDIKNKINKNKKFAINTLKSVYKIDSIYKLTSEADIDWSNNIVVFYWLLSIISYRTKKDL